MTAFKKGIAIVLAGGFLALVGISFAFPQGAVTLVQLVLGGTLVSSTNPLPVTGTLTPSSTPTTITGNVGGYDIVVTSNPTVQTSQYASGASLGGATNTIFLQNFSSTIRYSE